MFDGVINWLKSIADAIASLPSLILEGIKDIFIPDVKEIENILYTTVDNIGSQLGVQFNTLDRLFDVEVAPEDVNVDYNIPGLGTMNIAILETKYLIDGVAYFRPYIRAFLVFLLVVYNWYHILTLIGQDPRIAHSAFSQYTEWKNKKDGE